MSKDDKKASLAVYNVLDELNIKYSVKYHEPIFGKDDCDKECYHLPGLNLKNILIKDKKKDEFYLVILKDDERLDFKKYKEFTSWSNKATFASDEDLLKYLGVHAGSCSVFGLINDIEHKVIVVIDDYITSSSSLELINFHPNINTATLTMQVKDLFTFLNWTTNKIIKVK